MKYFDVNYIRLQIFKVKVEVFKSNRTWVSYIKKLDKINRRKVFTKLSLAWY